MRALEEEFEEKARQSYGGLWCEPVPHERKVATVREFYKAYGKGLLARDGTELWIRRLHSQVLDIF